MLAMRRFAPDVIVLDDAFQHLRLKRDLDLVLLDQRSPLGNGYLLPRGRLREPVSALHRAHALVFTRCNEVASSYHASPLFSHKPLFHTIHLPIIKTTHATDDPFLKARTDFSILQGKPAVAFSGLADNHQFFDSLERGGCRLVHKVAFGDHHQYSADDLDLVFRQAVAEGAELLITTAKDWVKIQPMYCRPLPLAAVDVRIGFQGDSARFGKFLSKALASSATAS